MIDISNKSMMIEEYETMFVNDKINEKDRRIIFDNIAYDVSEYRDVIFNKNEFYVIYVTTDLLNKKKREIYVTYQDHSLSMMNDNDKKY